MNSIGPIPPAQPPIRPRDRINPVLNRRSSMLSDIDEVILQLERLAGLQALPLTAREIIMNYRDACVRQAMEKVADEAAKYAASYEVKPAKPSVLPAPPFDSPPKGQPRRKSRKENWNNTPHSGWSNARKADYWRGMKQMIRGGMPKGSA